MSKDAYETLKDILYLDILNVTGFINGIPVIDGTSILAQMGEPTLHRYRRVGDSLEITLPRGLQVNLDALHGSICQHEFIDVGFAHSKIVCKHCDLEKT